MSSVVISGDTSGSITLNAPAVAGSTTINLPATSGTAVVNGANGVLVQGTAQNSTSGTSIDFTGIPSWAKRITVMLSGVSTNGASIVQVQLGSTTFTTTGYSQVGQTTSTSGSATTSGATTGFIIGPNSILSGAVRTGTIVFSNLSSNTWVGFGAGADTANTTVWLTNGSIGLSGALDRVRITTVNGTDTFDAGSINIMYE